MATGMYTRKPS